MCAIVKTRVWNLSSLWRHYETKTNECSRIVYITEKAVHQHAQNIHFGLFDAAWLFKLTGWFHIHLFLFISSKITMIECVRSEYMYFLLHYNANGLVCFSFEYVVLNIRRISNMSQVSTLRMNARIWAFNGGNACHILILVDLWETQPSHCITNGDIHYQHVTRGSREVTVR